SGFRPGLGGVRRHDHLRRQPAGCHSHAPLGDLSAARGRPRRRCGALAGAGGGGGTGHRFGPRIEGAAVTEARDLDAEIILDERGIDVRLRVAAGETVALLGPNGAGKSSVLSAIAGTLRPDRGQARLGDDLLFDLPAPGRGTWRQPHARGIALLAQDPLLFPHLTVTENVAFGPRSSGTPRRQARELA